MGLFSSKKTTNITENRTDVSNYDQRVAAADEGIALGQGASLDQSIDYSDSRSYVDQSMTKIETLADDVAIGSINAARALGESAFSLVNSGLDAQARSQRENRLLAENAIGAIADNTRKNLEDTLAVVEGSNIRASDTIKEVLGFKEAGDTKVAESLIKYGALAAALLAAAFIFRRKAA